MHRRARILFLGLDAADRNLILQWCDEGFLPVLSALLARGLSSETSNPRGLYTGAVWQVFFGIPAIVRRYTREQCKHLRCRAEASVFAWKGQELLRKREWRHARAYFLEALRMGSRDPRDLLCLVLTVLRAFPAGTRRWTGAFEALESETSMNVPRTTKTRSG
jgi:hypothetical protein